MKEKEYRERVINAIKEAFTIGNCSSYGCEINQVDLENILATNNL